MQTIKFSPTKDGKYVPVDNSIVTDHFEPIQIETVSGNDDDKACARSRTAASKHTYTYKYEYENKPHGRLQA